MHTLAVLLSYQDGNPPLHLAQLVHYENLRIR